MSAISLLYIFNFLPNIIFVDKRRRYASVAHTEKDYFNENLIKLYEKENFLSKDFTEAIKMLIRSLLAQFATFLHACII